MSFEEELFYFGNDVETAKRSYLYMRCIREAFNQMLEKDKAVRFWRDAEYSFTVNFFMALGRIFSEDKFYEKENRTLSKLLKELRGGKNSFHPAEILKKDALKERKFEQFKDKESLLEYLPKYMEDTYELTKTDVGRIISLCNEVRKKWDDNLKEIRDAIMAHAGVMDDEERVKLLQQGTYAIIEEIIGMLCALHSDLRDNYQDGRQPHFILQEKFPYVVVRGVYLSHPLSNHPDYLECRDLFGSY